MENRILFSALLVAFTIAPARSGEFTQLELSSLTDHMFSGGPGKDGIPAMTNPRFGEPEDVAYLWEDDLVMGVYRNGIAKAYPEKLGWWHEIINDRVGSEFISVTFCPLTGTALCFNATDKDFRQIEFGVSGALINSNLVMYDRRDDTTLYPQMIYTGINGSFHGQQLELLPMVETTWAMWKRMYPDTQVALAGTGLDRYSKTQRDHYQREERYEIYPYDTYREDHRTIFFPTTTATPSLDGKIAAKEIVLGVCRNGELKSYAHKDIPDNAVINDKVGGDPLLIVFDRLSQTAMVYSSVVAGKALQFIYAEPQGNLPVEMIDLETRSWWNMLGQSIDGPLRGTQLEQIPAYNAMWFAWDTYWHGQPVWQGEGIIEGLPPIDTAIETNNEILPRRLELAQNYPNPFNPSTHIEYNLPRDAEVDLIIYNTAGQKVRSLVSGFQDAGHYLYTWDARDDAGVRVASGEYLYRLTLAGEQRSETRLMVLVR